MIFIIYYPVAITGHVAIVLSGLKKKQREEELKAEREDEEATNVHISFYPDTVKSSKTTLFRLHGFKNDGTDVSWMIAIPSEESCGKGLSEAAIYKWWKEVIKDQTTMYGLLNNNCSSYVYHALLQGQMNSESLNKQILCKKRGWLFGLFDTPSTPGNIMEYADELNTILLANLNKEQRTMAEILELKEYRDVNTLTPFEKAIVMFSKLKKIPDDSDAVMLRRPYCKAVKKVLKAIWRQMIPQPNQTEMTENNRKFLTLSQNIQKEFARLTSVTDFESFNMEKAYASLHNLRLYIFDLTKSGKHSFEPLLQDVIKETLLPYMNRTIDNLLQPDFKDPQRIQESMKFLGQKVDDEQNPHRRFFLEGNKQDLGWWVRLRAASPL